MADDDDESLHALAPFLQRRLPELGLEYDTYGPYILPLLTDDEPDEEEWDTVMELLSASSELECMEEDVWTAFREEIRIAWKQHHESVQLQQQELHLQREMELKAQLEHDARTIAKEQELLEKEQQKQQANESSSNDTEAKRRLIAQYGYDMDDDNDDDPSTTPVSNREAAQQLTQAKSQAMREHKMPTKRDEQIKTAEARQNKQQLKEARRKRAVKGERKR